MLGGLRLLADRVEHGNVGRQRVNLVAIAIGGPAGELLGLRLLAQPQIDLREVVAVQLVAVFELIELGLRL